MVGTVLVRWAGRTRCVHMESGEKLIGSDVKSVLEQLEGVPASLIRLSAESVPVLDDMALTVRALAD